MLGLLSEILLRKIPNDYVSKKQFLDNNSDSIKVLFLGSSHALVGINPTYFSVFSFNAGYFSQSLDYDFEILKKYKNNWENLDCIVIPISYSSLYGRLETGIESWRVKNYIIYYEMNTFTQISNFTELFSTRLNVNLGKIYTYYIRGESNISCSNLGWGQDYNSKKKEDLVKTGITAAKRHLKKDDRFLEENIKILKSIIEFAKNKNVKVFLFTPPAYYTYVENLNRMQLIQTITTLIKIDNFYNNVAYLNFLEDSSFSAVDFYDADHLNEIGAKKFTIKLDSLIIRNKATTWQ
jgi:hypothetical protein